MTEIKDDQARAAAVSELVDAFVVSMMNTRIYPPTHPRVVASLGEIKSALQKAPFATGPVTLGVVDKCLVFEGRPLIGASLSAKRLIDAIGDRGAGAIELTSEVTEHELRALLGVLCTRPGELATIEDADRRLAAENCRWVRLLPPYARASGVAQAGLGETPEGLLRASALDSVTIPISLYQTTVQLLQSLTITVNQGSALSFETAQACIQDLLGQLRMDAGSLLRMSRYEQHDAYTFGHSIRVCMLAVNFARHLTADEALLNRIGVAALLHDIGKSKIPFEVLHCRTRLDSEQKRVMEQHSVLGAQILMDNGGCDPMCVACAFGHHLTTGTGGYPKLLHTPQLSLATKITKICDVYEALTAVRPYKDSMSPLRAFRIMLSMQNHFDGRLLRRFIEVNGIYPLGSDVILTTGEKARVEKPSSIFHLPVVRLLTTPEGEDLHPEDQVAMDLSGVTALEKEIRVAELVERRAQPVAMASS